ncbi:unnamed protein product [Cyclocybe aegerita]|uniref:Lysine-specific metallo-endopeptidase domain-containing protein n=1 Tax=Cyclocybe aegerita TaxID=1973307 RepID=A0A8S0WA75_CYCAE|nr:unnamed protein product [Cyclocybe aegerita]
MENFHMGIIQHRGKPKDPSVNAIASTRWGRPGEPHGEKQLKGIALYDKFHERTHDQRVGTLIHEASHAVGGTRDYFTPDKSGKMRAISGKETAKLGPGPGKLCGYLGKNFEELRDKASSVMHLNADSYKLFAYTIHHGTITTKIPAKPQAPPAGPSVPAPSRTPSDRPSTASDPIAFGDNTKQPKTTFR